MGAVGLAFSMEGMYGDGMNLYEYLGSNPWNRSDPLGLSWDPFSMVDDYLAETAGSRAAFLTQIGQDAAAVAVVTATIASYLPFPGVGALGDLALYALGEQTGAETAAMLALGVIPGGKLLGNFGSYLSKIGSSAWRGAKHYAGKFGKAVFQAASYATPLGLAKRALDFLGRKPGAACGCFTASTLVWTATGLIPIQQVSAGDPVLVRDEATGEVAYEPVTAEIVTHDAALLELKLRHDDGRCETIQTTDEHPFRLIDSQGEARWTRADTLEPGAILQTLEGSATVEAVSFSSLRTTVHNLSVAGRPNYFVGSDGVWGHNCPGYRQIFIEIFEASGRKFPAGHHVHHRIPQRYRDLFPDEVDEPSNWVGVPRRVHENINGEWNKFRARYKDPTADHVRTFVMWIDANYSQHYLRP